MPDIFLDPEDLAALANSRNHFRSVPSGQRFIEGPQFPDDTHRPAAIDIGEPGKEPGNTISVNKSLFM